MADNPAARSEVLRRVRAATGGSTGARPEVGDIERGWRRIRREYRRAAIHDEKAMLELLEARLEDYGAGVHWCGAAEVGELVGRILRERGRTRMAMPAGVPLDWHAGSARFLTDTRGPLAPIDACDGVLTSATLAIAETGTIVLQDVPGQGRRALTLLPDYHLCAVDAASVVETVPQAMEVLQRTARRATTFFSGPSATADIEMTRIQGVHGPRFVDVVIIV